MKKTILGIAFMAIVLFMMIGNVNAAKLTSSSTEVKKGDIVTVSVMTDSKEKGIQFQLDYNTECFKYVDKSAKLEGTTLAPTAKEKTPGKVRLIASSSDAEIEGATLTFEALKDTEIAANEVFSISEFEAGDETLNAETISIKVVTPEEPEQPEQPTEQPNDDKKDEQPTEQPNNDKKDENKEESKDSIKSEEKVGTNGEVIKKLPQTGTPIYVGAVAVILVAGIALVVRKINK